MFRKNTFLFVFKVKTVVQPSPRDQSSLSLYMELVDGSYLNEVMLRM